MQKKSFEDALKEKADLYTHDTKAGLWESIASELPSKEKKKRFIWLWFFAAASAACICIYVLNNLSSNSQDTIPKIYQSAEQNKKTIPNTNQENKNQITPKSSSPPVRSETHKANPNTTLNSFQENTVTHKKYQKTNHLKKESSQFEFDLPLTQSDKAKSSQINSSSVAVDSENIRSNAIPDVKTLESKTKDISSIPDSSELLNAKSGSLTESSLLDSTSRIDSILPSMALRPSLIRSFLQVYFSNGISTNQVALNSEFTNQNPYQNTYETLEEKSKTGYSYGFGANFGMESRRHKFGMGLKFQSISYKIPVVNVEGGIINSSTSGLGRFNYNATDSFKVESEENGASFVNSKYQFIQIPVFYSFNLIKYKRFSMNISNSLAYALLIKSEGLVQNNSSGLYLKPEKSEDKTITKSHFAYSIAPEISYQIKNRFHLQISPVFQTSLNPIEKGFIRTNYQFIGINTGILFYLN
jgi:hypothetical protein